VAIARPTKPCWPSAFIQKNRPAPRTVLMNTDTPGRSASGVLVIFAGEIGRHRRRTLISKRRPVRPTQSGQCAARLEGVRRPGRAPVRKRRRSGTPSASISARRGRQGQHHGQADAFIHCRTARVVVQAAGGPRQTRQDRYATATPTSPSAMVVAGRRHIATLGATFETASDWLTKMLIWVPLAAIVPGQGQQQTLRTAGVRRRQADQAEMDFWPAHAPPEGNRPAARPPENRQSRRPWR